VHRNVLGDALLVRSTGVAATHVVMLLRLTHKWLIRCVEPPSVQRVIAAPLRKARRSPVEGIHFDEA
jgi:hypothetical protein